MSCPCLPSLVFSDHLLNALAYSLALFLASSSDGLQFFSNRSAYGPPQSCEIFDRQPHTFRTDLHSYCNHTSWSRDDTSHFYAFAELHDGYAFTGQCDLGRELV